MTDVELADLRARVEAAPKISYIIGLDPATVIALIDLVECLRAELVKRSNP